MVRVFGMGWTGLQLGTFQSVFGNGIANPFPTFLGVTPQEQMVLGCNGADEIRYLPKVLASVIGADREHRLMAS